MFDKLRHRVAPRVQRAQVVRAVVASTLLSAAPAAARPAQRFDGPFPATQCDRAVVAGRRALAERPAPRARLLLAEGLLCRGFDGDVWALRTASDLLRTVLAEEPDNFFAELELADALRLRYPRSPEAADRLRRARVLLAHTDVGAARARLDAYVEEALAAVEVLEPERCQSDVASTELDDPALPPQRLAELAEPLLACGPRLGLVLVRRLARRRDATAAGLTLLLRAEALRGRAEVRAVRRLYGAAAARSCGATAPGSDRTCERARLRLEELQRLTQSRPTA